MTRLAPIFIALAAAFTLAAGIESPGDQIATTHHQIRVGQRTLRYTARAGRLPIRHNETGEIHGRMFFVAYLLDRAPNEPARPLTFLWNGGPGSNSTLVHLSGFGPKRIKSSDDPTGPPDCECELEDNQTTWLDRTDLVFVDPIGTGFSRPTRTEYGAEFYNTLGDIASVAEFVRVYRTRFDAWDAPLLIGGESYGVWRAGGVAEALVRRRQKVAGVILISGGIPVGPVVPDDMRTALFVPTRTAAAFFHEKLSPDLQTDLTSTLEKAETWAVRSRRTSCSSSRLIKARANAMGRAAAVPARRCCRPSPMTARRRRLEHSSPDGAAYFQLNSVSDQPFRPMARTSIRWR